MRRNFVIVKAYAFRHFWTQRKLISQYKGRQCQEIQFRATRHYDNFRNQTLCSTLAEIGFIQSKFTYQAVASSKAAAEIVIEPEKNNSFSAIVNSANDDRALPYLKTIVRRTSAMSN